MITFTHQTNEKKYLKKRYVKNDKQNLKNRKIVQVGAKNHCESIGSKMYFFFLYKEHKVMRTSIDI